MNNISHTPYVEARQSKLNLVHKEIEELKKTYKPLCAEVLAPLVETLVRKFPEQPCLNLIASAFNCTVNDLGDILENGIYNPVSDNSDERSKYITGRSAATRKAEARELRLKNTKRSTLLRKARERNEKQI